MLTSELVMIRSNLSQISSSKCVHGREGTGMGGTMPVTNVGRVVR